MVKSDTAWMVEEVQVLVPPPLLPWNGTLSENTKKQSVRREELDPGISAIRDGHELSILRYCYSERTIELPRILPHHSKGKQELAGGSEDCNAVAVLVADVKSISNGVIGNGYRSQHPSQFVFPILADVELELSVCPEHKHLSRKSVSNINLWSRMI